MDIRPKKISILNKIKLKPLIIEKIFSYSLNRSYVLFNIISNDLILKAKLNDIFSNIKQRTNKLNKEYNNNLLYLSFIKEIQSKLAQWLKEKQIKSISYNLIKSEINYSFIQYIYDLSIKFGNNFENTQMKKTNFKDTHFVLNKNIIKGIIFDYCSLLDNFIITLFPKDSKYLDNTYIDFIEEINIKSKRKNKMNQNIKLIIIFDENNYFDKIFQKIKYSNITEIIIIFDNEKMNKKNLLNYFDKYLSYIEHLENIHKIIFLNKVYNIYSTNNINTKLNNENYQSLLNDFFDNLYIVKKNNIKNILKLIHNIHYVYIENIGTTYIYEKVKLYYFINEIFLSLKSNLLNIENDNLQYFIYNNILILKNKDNPLKIYELFKLINDCLNKKKIEYLFIFNKNSLIYDEQQINYKNEKFNICNLKEFIYISENSENTKKLVKYFNKDEDNDYNIYEGYDEKNNLIFLRKGKTHIQSFDLINLFDYNKKLIKIKLINENIVINYNKERTKLEILNNNNIKNELNIILNKDNILYLNHFTQFIYNQNNLKELTINRFDFKFKDLINNNINKLNINYENDPLIMEYKLLDYKSNKNINILFPNLINLNLGGECFDLLNNIQIKDFPEQMQIIKIISKPIKKNKISKIQQKFNKYKKEFVYDFITYINNEENKDINENRENEVEEKVFSIEEDFSKYDNPIFYKKPGKIINYKNSSDRRPANRKYLPRLYYISFINNLKEKKFLKEFNNNQNKKNSFSILNYSNILQEYSKKSNIFHKIKEYFYFDDLYEYFCYYDFQNRSLKEIKLLYTFKKNFEKFKNIVDKETQEGFIYVPVIKMDCGLYFFRKFFTSQDYSNYNYDLTFRTYEDSTRVDIGSSMMLENSFSEGTFLYDIQFNNSIISKNTKFKILKLELYKLIIPDIIYNQKNGGYSSGYKG